MPTALIGKIVGTLILSLVLLSTGLYLWGQWKSAESALKTAENNLQTALETIEKNDETIKFQREASAVKDAVYLEQSDKQVQVDAQLQRILQKISTYKPKEDTDESRCLDLVPPADFIEWVSEQPGNTNPN